MKKTNLSLTTWSLMLLLMVMLVPQGAWAKLEGYGTEVSPYLIRNADDMMEYASIVNSSNGEYHGSGKLMANIDLTGKTWTPLGTTNYPFTKTFDGNNKTISGLNLTATAANAGFFGYVNGATIKNFTLAGTVSSGYENTGSVVGTANGSTKIYNVYSSVNITMTAAKNHIGGIMGQALQSEGNTVEIKGCTYSGTMNLGSSTDSNGGIVGYCGLNANIEIENCFFSGSISSTGSNPRIGGILGYADDDGNTQNFKYIRNCFCDGTLSPSTGNYVGIFAGYPRGKVKDVITNNTYVSTASTNMAGNSTHTTAANNGCKKITISVTAGSNGTVSHSYVNPSTEQATQLEVVATPNAHYHLNKWSDSGAQTHNVGLTDNVSLTASFAIDQHTISVATNNANYGTVSGGGTFDYNSTKTITATPKEHYHFVEWNDGDKNASRTITVTEDKTYTATFAPNQYTITVKTNDSNMGTVSGGGKYDYNTQQTITATPKTGYHFVKWSDGNTSASRTITVNGNATYTATFAAHTYGDWITDVAATCTTSGTKHSQCTHTGCDDRIDGTIPALGHDYAQEFSIDTEPTCSSDGSKSRHCSRCEAIEGTVIPATGHSFADDDLAQGVCTTCHHGFFRYTSKDNVVVKPYYYPALTDADGNQLTHISNTNVDGKGVIEFNKPLANIGTYAFYRQYDLTGMTIPNSVTGIGNAAFASCTGFTGDLVIPESVTSIGNSAFDGCGFTGDLVIPTSVTSIGNFAFDGCSGFTGNLVIPESVTSIGKTAFSDCTGFKSVEFNSIPQVRELAFSGVTDNVTLTLTDNSYIYTGAYNLPAVTSATFNREIVADGGMYSFIVPFDIPAGQAAELGKFYQYTSHDPEERKVYFDDIAEVSDGVVKANTAYFFKPAKDITSFTVNNPSIPRTLTIPDPEYPSVPGLYGTYSEIEVPVGAYGYAMQGAESTFVRAGYGNVLRPFRAYLWLGSGAYMAKALAFFGDYDDITGINNIETDSDLDMSKPIYTLSGQRIMTPKKGEIYIQNGKKVIKK